MATLTQLRDALTALKLSTDTGGLRGEARRNELAKRLQHAKGEIEGFEDSNGQELQKWSLSELRSALELRQVSTQTPGLKGEVRRHALLQRLMNAYNKKEMIDGVSSSDVSVSTRSGSCDDDDDTKSVTSFSSYSTAGEFIFYDSQSCRTDGASEVKLEATSLMPRLSFSKLKIQQQVPESTSVSKENSIEQLERELFELRDRLHTSRKEQQQEIERSLQEAGITTTLDQLSARLQALERERRRLQQNYFAHELVTSAVLTSELSGNDMQSSLEFVQGDALVLIQKCQGALKQLAERTKEAVSLVKYHELQSSASAQTSRQKEESLVQQIQLLEVQLSSKSHRVKLSSRPETHSNLFVPVSLEEGPSSERQLRTETLVLARCRSMPIGLVHDQWDKMNVSERKKLHYELRKAVSFRIRRDRVTLEDFGASSSSNFPVRAPSQADKLGMKARFMEKVKRDPKEILEVYEKALEVDGDHAENLGSYALFLCKTCAHIEQAQYFFRRALDKDPTNAKNLANYANFLGCVHGDFSASEAHFKRALDVAPDDVNILGAYADLLSANSSGADENLRTARRLLKKSLKLIPNHIKNQLRSALVLSKLGEGDLAERCFEQLLLHVREPPHEASDNADSDNQTLDGFHKQVDQDDMVVIYESYASFLHKRGQWVRAKCMYDKALTIAPLRQSLLRELYV